MGDIYHAGEVYAGSVPIDDTQASEDTVYSSAKVETMMEDVQEEVQEEVQKAARVIDYFYLTNGQSKTIDLSDYKNCTFLAVASISLYAIYTSAVAISSSNALVTDSAITMSANGFNLTFSATNNRRITLIVLPS